MLPSNCTISEVVHLLADPIGFTQGVLESFVTYGYDPHTSVVRIGRSGSGRTPNYKVEDPAVLHRFYVEGPQEPIELKLLAMPSHTLCGRNHREMVELDDMCRGNSWSTTTSTFAELQMLLGACRTIGFTDDALVLEQPKLP